MSNPSEYLKSLVFFHGALSVLVQVIRKVGVAILIKQNVFQRTLFPRGKVTVEDAILKAYEKHPGWSMERWIEFVMTEAPKVTGKDQLFQRLARYPKLISQLREYFATLVALKARGITGVETTRID